MTIRREKRLFRRLGRCVLALLGVWVSVALHGWAQMLESSAQVRDVPFQATQVVTRASRDGTTETRGRMARDAAGSTYVELVDAKSGVATTAFLLDVPGQRGIVLDLLHKRYSIRPAPHLTARELSLAAVPEQLLRASETRGRSEQQMRNGAEATVTHLGTKLISGLMAIGSREAWPTPGPAPHPAKRELESWYSVDLGLFVRMTETDRARGETTGVALTEILRVPPNGAWFRIPDGFQPEGTAAGVPAGPTADGE